MRSKALERVRNAIARRQPAAVEARQDRPRSPWLSFRYAYRSITADEGSEQAHVVAREARFEDGKLETEELEGTLDRRAAAELLGEMQRLLHERVTALLRPLSSLLLTRRPDDPEEEE